MNEQSENVTIAPSFKHAGEKLDVYVSEEMEPDDLKSIFQFWFHYSLYKSLYQVLVLLILW